MTVRYDPSGTDEPDEPEEGEVIYYDDLDAVVTSDNYWIDQSDEYINKTGSGAASVEYSGSSVGIRSNYKSTGYQGASGDNAFYFGSGSWFEASGIELPAGVSTFRISFGVAGDNVDKGSFTANEDLVLLIGNTATGDYRQVTYQRPGTSTSWGFAQADFRIDGDVPQKVSIRLEGSWNVRVDDLRECRADCDFRPGFSLSVAGTACYAHSERGLQIYYPLCCHSRKRQEGEELCRVL